MVFVINAVQGLQIQMEFVLEISNSVFHTIVKQANVLAVQQDIPYLQLNHYVY